LHGINWSDGEKKKERKLYSSKKPNSIEDLLGNEENEYPVPDPNETMINVTTEFSDTHKKSLNEEIMGEITEKLMRSYKTWLTRKCKMHSRNIKTPQKKNLRRHRNN
jgi:hypothetical protein